MLQLDAPATQADPSSYGGSITVGNGTTLFPLLDTGSTGAVSVDSGGILQIGLSNVWSGALDASSVNFSSGSTAKLPILGTDGSGPTANDPATADVSATGAVNLDGATLELTEVAPTPLLLCTGPAAGTVITLIQAGSVTGTFASVPNGAVVNVTDGCGPSGGQVTAEINYTANSVTATIVNQYDAPQATAAPTISGTPQVGEELTSSTGTWSGEPTSYAYQWSSCNSEACTPISGATSGGYVPTSAVVGDTITVTVTASSTEGSNSETSPPTSAVAPLPPVPANTAAPSISGAAEVGDTVTVSPGSWSGSPTDYLYLWELCDSSGDGCTAIGEATRSNSLTLSSTDAGHTVRAQVRAENSSGWSSVALSHPSGVIAASVLGTAAPIVTGTPLAGATLHATMGTFSGTGLSYAYVWERCTSTATSSCSPISGATSSSYTITDADAGTRLRVVTAAYNADDDALEVSVMTAPIEPISEVARAMLDPLDGIHRTERELTFVFHLPFAGTLTVTCVRGHATVATGVATVHPGASTTVRLKLTSAGRRLLARTTRTLRIRPEVTYKPTGAPATRTSTIFALKP